jgi:ribosomal-protein-alanine N-acetyltransferase
VCAEFEAAKLNGPGVGWCRIEDLPEIEIILHVCPEAAVWSADALADALRAHPQYFFVVRGDRGIAGFVCGRKMADEAEILNLAVCPAFRKRGIGAALVSKLLYTFAQDGVSQIFLEVRESNFPAISFYRNLGFHHIGRRPSYYENPQEAALVLARRLL